ncbi:hypothetical protein [Deinococcus saxicola]|uniref:hypothetical protein n=1 Tax=Deinococcus saxicola TaxID=249406 RepID=UPI0039F11B3F
MLTPWAGILTLVCCPVLLLWAVRQRRGWLALSTLAVMLVPLVSPPLPEGWCFRFVWTNWFGTGVSVISNGMWWVGI